MVPGVLLDLLASTSKFYDAGYITLFGKEKVNICGARTTTVTASKPLVLKGWRDAVITLWLILLVTRAPGSGVSQVTSRFPGVRATSWNTKQVYSLPP